MIAFNFIFWTLIGPLLAIFILSQQWSVSNWTPKDRSISLIMVNHFALAIGRHCFRFRSRILIWHCWAFYPLCWTVGILADVAGLAAF